MSDITDDSNSSNGTAIGGVRYYSDTETISRWPFEASAHPGKSVVGAFTALIDRAFTTLAENASLPLPLMVDRHGAARLCGMSVATYEKYSRKGLLPPMNAVGRVSVETLKRACQKLDGLSETDIVTDPAERELLNWERKRQ